MKAYVLPGMRPSELIPQGVEVISPRLYRGWFTWVIPRRRNLTDLAQRHKLHPEVNILIGYVPGGYTKAYNEVLETMRTGGSP